MGKLDNKKFKTQNDLYKFLLPAFNVKTRINKYYGYNVSNEMMWNYLGKNKWKNSINLTVAQMVNDIIVLDIIEMKGKMIVYE